MSQIIDEDQQHVLKQPSSSNSYFTFKNGRKIEEGIEHNPSLGERGRSVCNVTGCGFTVEGKETNILLNHLKKHKIEYAQFLSRCKEKVAKVGSVPRNANTVKTTIKDKPTVEEKVVASPVSQINGAVSLITSPNLTVDNCDINLPVLQENVERGLPQRQCLSELPLNSPLTMPVFLPLGTTLIVLDPSTLKMVHAYSSQNFPPKVKKTSSPMPPMIVENVSLVDAPSSCATRSLLKCSQPTANPNSLVNHDALAGKGMAADYLNHARSPPGSFNLAQPYSCSPRTTPIEHIRLQAFPTPGNAPSPSTETTNIYKTNSVTASIPTIREVKIVSLSHQTTSFSSTMHPSEVIEQTNLVKNSFSANPSEQEFISQSTSAVLFTETLHANFTGSEPLGAVHEHLKVTVSKKQPSVSEQPQQPSIPSLEQHPNLLSVNQLGTTKTSPLQVENTENSSLLFEKSSRINDNQAGLLGKDVPLTAFSEMTEQLEPSSHGECMSTMSSFKKSLPMAIGITVASFAKIGDESARTALLSMPPSLESIVPIKDPLAAASTSHSEDSPNSNELAANSPTIPNAEPSPVTELDVRHNGSVSGTANVCDQSLGETVEASYERTHPVFQFFKFNSVHGKSECIVDGCGVLRNGKNPANLINHLRAKHPKKAYAEFMAKWTTMWARPKRTTTMVNVTNIDIVQPQTTREKKAKKKKSSTQDEKGTKRVPSSVHTRDAFPLIVPDLVSTGSVAPQGSPDGGPIPNENPSVGSNIHQAILTDGGNSATHSYRKDSFNEKLHPVYRYFTFREATEGPAQVTQDNCVESECNFQGCNFTIKGNKLANLMLHLSLKHRETKEFAKFISLNEKYEAQRRKSMYKYNPSDRIQPQKRPLVQTAGNTYQEYLACRKKQRKCVGVGAAMSPFSLVKGQQNLLNHPTTSIMDGQQLSPNVTNKAAVQLSVQTPALDFIGPDIPFEYSS